MVAMDRTGALNGTAGAATKSIYTFTIPVQVVDWNIVAAVGGTAATHVVTLCKSLAGTGAATAFGTQALGTHANLTVVDAACTATNFTAGDDLVLQVAGTGGAVYDILALVEYIEVFEAGDN